MHLIRAFKSEFIKTKASGIKWLCLGAAAFIPVLQVVFRLVMPKDIQFGVAPDNPWMDFIEGSFTGFAPFFYPLLLVLIAVRLAQFEHKSDTWKLIETQPVTKASLYFAKWIMAMVLALVCLLLLLLISCLAVYIYSFTSDAKEFQTSSIEWGKALWLMLRIWIAGLGLLAIQYFISVRVPNFVAPFVIGLIATIAGSIMSGFDQFSWWPYSAPAFTASYYKQSESLLPHEKLSIAYMVLFLYIGYVLFVHKKIKYSFFQPAIRIVPLLLLVALFGVTLWLVTRPTKMEKVNKTVLAGEFKIADTLKRLYLLDPVSRDTLETTAISNNKFVLRVNKPLQPMYYIIRAGNEGASVFFGTGDSVYIKYSGDKLGQKDMDVTGTRIAENNYQTSRASSTNFWYLEQRAYEHTPAQYANMIIDEWETGVKNLNKFKTANNVRPADDFIAMKKKMLALRLVQMLDIHYPKVFSIYYPNDTLKFPASVNVVRKAAGNVMDSSLIAEPQYIQFLDEYYRAQPGINSEADYFNYITNKLPDTRVKDVLLYNAMLNTIDRIADSSRREMLITAFGSKIKSANLKQSLLSQNQILNTLQKGKPAPPITAEALTGNLYELMPNLKDKYIVIDVWATWCGPCKKEAPHFKRLAEQYTSRKIVFVSLSVDEDKNAWKIQAPGNSRVVQLWARNAEQEIYKAYNVASIPRFMLIDDRGKIVNAQMPPPSDPKFEQILVTETPAVDYGFNWD